MDEHPTGSVVVPSGGFVWRDEIGGKRLVRAAPGQRDAAGRTYLPAAQPGHYLKLAYVPPTAEHVVRLANQHGWLAHPPYAGNAVGSNPANDWMDLSRDRRSERGLSDAMVRSLENLD